MAMENLPIQWLLAQSFLAVWMMDGVCWSMSARIRDRFQ
jgi:hypothetical protein